jgi:hypothetical protein
VAERLMPDLPGGGGYILGDGEYDATGVYDATGRAGYQLLAPREAPGAGLGHRRRSPYRLRSIELLGKAFGREVYRLRRLIEGRFGQATSFGGGLARLPAWVRRLRRVRPWVFAKLVIDGVRDARNKGLMARMQ